MIFSVSKIRRRNWEPLENLSWLADSDILKELRHEIFRHFLWEERDRHKCLWREETSRLWFGKLNTNQINWNQKYEKRMIMDADDFM